MENKKMISLEISETLRENLRVEAFNRNKTVSATIRDILENYMRENSNGDNK